LYITLLTLSRLAPEQVADIATYVAGGKTLPAEVCRQVVAHTDGIPLFVEELTKTILDMGLLRVQTDHYELVGPLRPLAIPATLQDALMARLDRLATVKTVAQLGAVMGRQFPYELLAAVAPMEERALQQALEHLIEVELLTQRGIPPRRRIPSNMPSSRMPPTNLC
jgi:predicted ATPase